MSGTDDLGAPVSYLTVEEGTTVFTADGEGTIEQGTTFMTWVGSAWSSADDPFPQAEAEQLALAVAWDRQNVRDVTVTVDEGPTVDIHTPRFELFSPQRTVSGIVSDGGVGNALRNVSTGQRHGSPARVRACAPN